MKKYYTRACNFYYGKKSEDKIKKKKSLPLNGNPNISFDSIELITSKNSKIFHIKIGQVVAFVEVAFVRITINF